MDPILSSSAAARSGHGGLSSCLSMESILKVTWGFFLRERERIQMLNFLPLLQKYVIFKIYCNKCISLLNTIF